MSLGIVLYTDGGAKQNPAGRTLRMGFGVHGYLYNTEKSKQGNGAVKHVLTQTGYVNKNEHEQEKQPEVTAVTYFDIYGSSQAEGNSYAAEVLALINALKLILEYEVGAVSIFTDSEVVVRLINDNNYKIIDGKPVNIKGKPVSHPELINELLTLVTAVREKTNLSVRWVKGHSDFVGNQFSDVLASLGTEFALNGKTDIKIEKTDAKGYWKYEVDKSSLLNLKRLYFRTDSEDRNVYYMSNPKKDELLGRRTTESCYSVVILKTPDKAIETLRNKFDDVIELPSLVASVRLDKLYSKNVHKNIITHGSSCIRAKLTNGRSFNLIYLDGEDIAEEIYPQALSMRMVDNFNYLKDILDGYNETGQIRGKVFDITGEFYELQTVKKETVRVLRKEVNLTDRVSVVKKIPVKGELVETTIHVNLGLDLPDRNTLKRIESEVEEVALAVWYNSETVVNYGFILKTKEGAGIWSNFFSNKLFLR